MGSGHISDSHERIACENQFFKLDTFFAMWRLGVKRVHAGQQWRANQALERMRSSCSSMSFTKTVRSVPTVRSQPAHWGGWTATSRLGQSLRNRTALSPKSQATLGDQ